MKNGRFARFAPAIFICLFLIFAFRCRSRPIKDLKWSVLQVCDQREHTTTNFQFLSFTLQTAYIELIPG